MSYEKTEAINRLREIQGKIEDLVREADGLIRQVGRELTYERARSYWLAHIKGALDGRGSMVTMQQTLNELEEELGEERQ